MEDQAHMNRALQLAERGLGRVSPNPLVGAVILASDGTVAGEGWHEGPGTPHAEVMALAAAGDRARGGTAVVTLEPCNHTGRTGPCTEALLSAGVTRVIAAIADPNPVVNGTGFDRLRAAGLDVRVGLEADRATALNRAFERHVLSSLPFVILKMASSLDGKTAAADGTSRWITGTDARGDVQRMRAWADAVLIGSGTALADDPSLSLRDPAYAAARPPLRVLVDSSGRVPARGHLFDGSVPTSVVTTDRAPDARLREWESAGVEVSVCDRGADDRVSLPALMRHLGKRDIQGVLLEGGATIAWGAVAEGIVDEVVLYLAPKLVGGAGAPSVLSGTGFAPITEALDLDLISAERIGPDLKVVARVHGDHRGTR
ncbi:MAG: diaminohydroxyphosphoribosylaminopyrimidine deaminase [Actinomycetota bacterium]|jgi:diaminohydroxyphosphoribosylaminopyrimidine deaminase/5-amino-6-(5-phosphoribosylamino)uracil reductase|nr:diaminohydroxyphosphoribosylaminopyrimidine deaminase [Actinomycetota bacterium]